MSSRLAHDLYEAGRTGNVLEIHRLLKNMTMTEARQALEHRSVVTEPILNIAVRFKQESVVRDLVEYFGVNVDSFTDDETSPLMQSVLGGNIGILRILHKKLKDPNRGFPMHRVCSGETPNGIQILKIMAYGGADINLKNHKGLTPLMIACQKRSTHEMVKILLQLGAMVNLTSPNGNTALHYAIQQTDVMMKEPAWDRLHVLKMLVKHGAESKPNKQGLSPSQLASIKGNAEMLTFLASSLNDTELADCHELLASSIYFNNIKRDGKFAVICKINEVHQRAYKHLETGMTLRYYHNPPLWKFNNQERAEGLLYHVETQTFEELTALKNHGEGLLVELILARQRILHANAYEDHLMPFITEYFLYLKNQVQYSQAIALLSYKMRLQLRIPQRKFEHTVIFLLGLFRSYRERSEKVRIDDQKVAKAIVSFIEECYESDVSEKRFLLRWLYLTPMHLLYLCLCNPSLTLSGTDNVRGLTMKFLRATVAIKESVLSTYSHCEDAYLFGSCTSEPYRAVAGDNALHVACRHIPRKEYPSYGREKHYSKDRTRALSTFLQMLHACGEDINLRNSEGKTPLNVLLDRHAPAMRTESRLAVHALLMDGADPDIKDKHEQTAVHAVITGYMSSNCIVSCDSELTTVLRMLLKSGADPNAQDRRGFTPLHLLIDRRTSGNVQSINGENTRRSFFEVVQLIQEYGGMADLHAHDGRSALDMCKDSELEREMRANLLLSRGKWMKLSSLAARTIRLCNVPYQDTTPPALVQVIELDD